MKYLIKILFVVIVFCQYTFAQTITKEASKRSVYIGEEFFYTITVENLSNLNDLDKIVDKFGPEIDYLGIEFSPSIQLLLNWQFCGNIQDNLNTINNTFTLDFVNCNGSILGLNSISFKLKVKLNKFACGKTVYKNQASIFIDGLQPIDSNISTVNIKEDDPYQLQKTFRNYNSVLHELTYDVRLSSSSGNFDLLDFINSTPTFSDTFSIPNCFTLSPVTINNSKVVYVSDENFLNINTAVPSTISVSGSDLVLDWQLPSQYQNNTSILFQVKIKVDDCTCYSSQFQLQNAVSFESINICGDQILKNARFEIPRAGCNPPISGGGGIPDIPEQIIDSIRVSKSVKLLENDLNLTMKGCKGQYIITIENSSGRLNYRNFNLKDVIPSELHINGNVTITGNAVKTLVGNDLTVSSNGRMLPNDLITIKIPFEVNTPIENLLIKNCGTIDVNGDDGRTSFSLNRNFCSSTITTVPNTVAIHTSKLICSDTNKTCGQGFNSNINLPGDTVEYALYFYNYGTVEARNILISDKFPNFFKIQNINTDVKVYKKFSGQNLTKEDICELKGFNDITGQTTKAFDPVTNKLEIKLNNEELDAFTCNGVEHFIVKVKVKIEDSAPNDTYKNQFIINYLDPSIPNADLVISNEVPSVVNVDQLILGWKRLQNNGFANPNYFCGAKKAQATYEIVLANMGDIPVFANIQDIISPPNGVTIIPGSTWNFKMCKITNPASYPFCTPTPNPSLPSSVSSNGFTIDGLELKPCEVTVITYTVLFDTNMISKGETLKVCNNANIKAYIPGKNKAIAVLTSDPSLIYNYTIAKTDKEKLEAIALIKAVKKDPEILKNQTENEYLKKRIPSKKNVNIDLGEDKFDFCFDLKDCIPGASSGCLTDVSTPFNFSIKGMNSQGEITTSLNNLGKKVTQIEYLLTDIRQIDTCEDEVFYFKNKPYTRSCFGCSENVTGIFSTTNTSSIGLLNYMPPPNISGTYREGNKVEFKGAPTVVTQDNRTFKFPVGLNCNGTFEFTITAIVHFEDCSVCYVTDSFDYNASWRFTIPPRHTPILTGPRHF